MNTTKFLLNGEKVEVLETLSKGFLVQRVYSLNDNDEEEEFADKAHPFVAENVYDVAPIEKLDKRVRELNDSIAQLTVKKNELNREVNDLGNLVQDKLKLYKTYIDPALNQLDVYLENKVTHFAYVSYGTIGIVDIKKEFPYANDFRLFFEVDFTNRNKIKWGSYIRKDSYDRVESYPCSSYDEALDMCKKLAEPYFVNESLPYCDSVIASAQKLNIPLPPDYLDRVKKHKMRIVQTHIDNKEKELVKLKEELSAF